MVTSLEFMTAEVKRPFFISKFVNSWQIFSFFKQTRLEQQKNIDGNDVLCKKYRND